ncbi:hypothetical protein ACFL3C_02205 [Patescibacteria group bacterium]
MFDRTERDPDTGVEVEAETETETEVSGEEGEPTGVDAIKARFAKSAAAAEPEVVAEPEQDPLTRKEALANAGAKTSLGEPWAQKVRKGMQQAVQDPRSSRKGKPEDGEEG